MRQGAMTPDRWKEIKEIFEEALTQPILTRANVVHSLCHGDQHLEAEVKDLLGAHESADGFLEKPAVDLRGYLTAANRQPSFAPGSVIAKRFEILSFLNRGGMGEVYEAWDSELKERVALKTIRPAIAFDSDVIERFKREVKQARAISHPNVCRVHELFVHEAGSEQRTWLLSMELLEGPTLRERILYQGPMERKLALNLVQQMVSGLAAAHALGVVHRDFKSSNVMLVPLTGSRLRAVITDFGLALSVFMPREGPPEPAGQGTPDYMAPEQKENSEVSFPADQYALGIVMCEMIAGCLPDRARQIESGAGSPVKLPEHSFGPRWDAVIGRCLEARPEDRFENVEDVITALVPPRRFSWWQVAAAALIVLLVMFAVLFRKPGIGSRISETYELTSDTGLSDGPSLSRDGKMIAYVSDRGQPDNMDVFVQQLPNGKLKRVTEDPASEADASLAPDGSSVAFRSERKGGGIYISTVDFSKPGGDEHLFAPGGRNPRFSPDGRAIAYWVGDLDEAVPSGEIYVRPLDGEAIRLAANFKDARLPVWSSDGHFILFSGCRAGRQPMPACTEWWVSRLDGKVVKNTGAMDLMFKEQLQPWGPIGAWYADRVLFTARKGTTPSLWELRLPEPEFRAVGKPEQLTSGELRESNPSLAADRTLAFEHLVSSLHVARIDGASHPKTAVPSMVTADAAIDLCPFVSHDGHWLAFVRGSGSKWSPWVKDLHTGVESPFPFAAEAVYSPIIDDVGDTIVFEALENSVPSIFVAKRGMPDRKLCTVCSTPTGWLEDGKTFFYREGLTSSIKLMDVDTGAAHMVMSAKGAALSQASWSAENEYLLFTETRPGGSKQVFAVRFPKSTRSVVGERIPITDASEGSDQPRWSGDGKTIFYLSTRDTFACIWARTFDPRTGKKGPAFPVAHYHNPAISISMVVPTSFNLSVAGDSIFFDLGEATASIWIGMLKPKGVSLIKK